MKKIIFFTLYMCVFQSFIRAQWVEYFQNESIKIEYLKQECTDVRNGTSNIYVFFKITNKTSEVIDVYYNVFCIYQNDKKTYKTDGDKVKHNIRLAIGQSVQGDCNTKQKNLKIYAGSMKRKGSVLKEFEVTNIEIKRAK